MPWERFLLVRKFAARQNVEFFQLVSLAARRRDQSIAVFCNVEVSDEDIPQVPRERGLESWALKPRRHALYPTHRYRAVRPLRIRIPPGVPSAHFQSLMVTPTY